MRTKDSNFAIRLIFTISLVPKAKCQICATTKTADGLTVANCTNLNLHHFPTDKFPDDVQIADFTKNPNLETKGFFMEKYSGTLIRLILIGVKYPASELSWGRNVKLDVFSKLYNLEDFDFSDAELRNYYQWVLPPGLKKYSINNNEYTFVDVSSGPDLEELNVNHNYIEAIPKFHHPLPPLKILRGKNNPFHTLTVLDIAPLCYLTVFELEPLEYPMRPEDSSELLKKSGFCNCTLLKQFASEYVITGVSNMTCFEATDAEVKKCLNHSSIYEARKIRKACPLLTKGELPNTLKTILKIIFFSTLFLLFLATLILYIIRHFHLKEMWANYHHYQATPKAEEAEEEQSFQGQESSISDGSLAGGETPVS